MRVLLFGPTGQIGTEIARRRDVSVIPVDRAACDLTTPGEARAVIAAAECDAVVNAAAYTAVDRAESEPSLAESANARAPGEMAAATAERGLPFIHFSTDYVFDGAAAGAWREDDATAPLNVYGRTKLEGERRVTEAGGASAVIRTSWVFSAHGGNFVKTMLRLADSGKPLRIVADQRGKPTPAAALADAAIIAARALKSDPSKAGLYHFAGDEAVSWADFAAAVFETAKRDVVVEPITTKDYPTPARRPANSVLDTSAFERTFGLAAPSWRKALKDVLSELGAV